MPAAIDKAKDRIDIIKADIKFCKEGIAEEDGEIEKAQESKSLHSQTLRDKEKDLARANGYLKAAVKKYHDSL